MDKAWRGQQGAGCKPDDSTFRPLSLRPGAVSLLFSSEGLLLYLLTVIDSYKLLCQSARKSIMKMMHTCLKMIVNCFWLIRIMSCGDANQHWAYIVPVPAGGVAAATSSPK